jgi:hypothetical protein
LPSRSGPRHWENSLFPEQEIIIKKGIARISLFKCIVYSGFYLGLNIYLLTVFLQ